MAKNTTIFTLFQNFISQEETKGILAEFSFDTTRKCDVLTLLNYLMGATAFEWKSLRHVASVAFAQALFKNKFRFCKKRKIKSFYKK